MSDTVNDLKWRLVISKKKNHRDLFQKHIYRLVTGSVWVSSPVCWDPAWTNRFVSGKQHLMVWNTKQRNINYNSLIFSAQKQVHFLKVIKQRSILQKYTNNWICKLTALGFSLSHFQTHPTGSVRLGTISCCLFIPAPPLTCSCCTCSYPWPSENIENLHSFARPLRREWPFAQISEPLFILFLSGRLHDVACSAQTHADTDRTCKRRNTKFHGWTPATVQFHATHHSNTSGVLRSALGNSKLEQKHASRKWAQLK